MFLPLFINGQNRAVSKPMSKKKDAYDNRFKYNSDEFRKHVTISIDGGFTALRGENKSHKLSYNGRLGLVYNFSQYISVKANVGYGLFDGDFSNHNKTLLEANYFEALIRFRIDLISIFKGYSFGRKTNIYPTIGAGQVQSRIKFKNADNTITGIGYDNGMEGYTAAGGLSGRIVVLTYSLGVEIERKINNNWWLYIDLMAARADSDRIDGIVTVNSSNDWHATANIGLNYKIRKKEKSKSPPNCYDSPKKLLLTGDHKRHNTLIFNTL